MAFSISSSDFQNGAEIPKKFTCDGADSSPELSWIDPPTGTRGLALIADDPDAPGGIFTHWVLFNLPADIRNLSANVSKVDELPNGARQGKNGFRKIGYGGPCPPPGKPHRYFFKLYALDRQVDLKPGATREELEQAIQGHTIGKAEIMGKYGR
jgi:Raf kinase inhibitor-like YbhB/YbcL family protein